MSDKALAKLNALDAAIRRAYPCGMRGGNNIHDGCADVVIRKVTGFELFNSRPYHNYETWSDGYEACDGTNWVSAEDLDTCIHMLVAAKNGTADHTIPDAV